MRASRRSCEARCSSMKSIFLKCLPFLGMALATTPAWAGSWSVGLDYDGKSVAGSITRPWRDGGWTGDDGPFQSTSTPGLGAGQTQQGSCSGRFILLLHWTPASADDKIPPRISVKFQQTVTASGGRSDMSAWPSAYQPAPGTPGSVTLSAKVATPDGTSYSDSNHERTDNHGYHDSSFAQHPPVIVVVSTNNAQIQPDGTSLVSYSLPSIEGTFNVTMGAYKVETDPGVFDTYGDGTNAHIVAEVNYALDNREVYLTRGSSAPKIKGAPGVTIDEAHDEWREVDSNGLWTTHGQSRYSYQSLDPTDPGTLLYDTHTQVVTNAIGANKSGSWSSNLSATWSPGSNFDTTGSTRVDSPDGGAVLNNATVYDRPDLGTGLLQPGWYKTPSSGTGPNVTYSLTDKADGAKATAKYVLQLHDEWEKPMDDTPSETTRTGTWVVGGWSSHTGADTHTFEWNFTEEHEVALTTTFGADFKLKDWLNIGGKVETSSKFKANVVTGASVTLKGGEKARPYMRYTIRTQHKLVDHYVVAGFDRNQGRADGKWPQSADLALRIPDDIEALWQGPLLTSNPNPGEPT